MRTVSCFTTKLLATAVLWAAALAAAGDSGRRPDSSITQPFLEVFFSSPTRLETGMVLIKPGATQVSGYMAYPTSDKRLPAVLLLASENPLGLPVLRIAREVAGIGFVALAIDYDPDHTAGISSLVQTVSAGKIGDSVDAAMAWIAEQPFVDGRRIGAVGWESGAAWVLRLAQEGKLQAAVVSGGSICAQPDELFHVSATPLLVVGDRRSGCAPSIVSALQQRIVAAGLSGTVDFYRTATAAFPDGARAGTADDQLWVNICEFLSKHFQDAPGAAAYYSGQEKNQIASIVDIMRVINSDDGVRGRLTRSLASAPSGDEQWEQARSEAALLAEGGNLLLALRPPKGPAAGWRERAIDFRRAAETLLRAIERRDFIAVQQALRVLPKSCASCHADYR